MIDRSHTSFSDTGAREGFAELAWRVAASRTGAPTLWLAGRSVHSTVDPTAEAERSSLDLAERAARTGARAIVLIGLGLGLVAAALRRRTALPLVAFEPFAGVAAALRETGAMASLEGVEVVHEIADCERALCALRDASAPVLAHRAPVYQELCRFEARWLLRELRRGAGGLALDPASAIVSRRAVDAMRRLVRHQSIDAASGVFEGQTVFLVSPGPSLAPALSVLAKRRGGVVVAALQALRPLLAAGIEPDLVVAPDPLHFAPFVEGLDPRFSLLAADAGAPPGLLDRWPDRTALFSLASRQLHHVGAERLEIAALDEPFLTVSEIALVLAWRLGARDLVQIGADFVSEDARYAFRFDVRGAGGARVPTNSHYFHGARDLCWRCPRLIAQGGRIRRMRGGLPVTGAEEIDPVELERAARSAPIFSADRRERLEAAGRRAANRQARCASLLALIDPRMLRSNALRDEQAAREPAGSPQDGGRFADFDPLPAAERDRQLAELRRDLAGESPGDAAHHLPGEPPRANSR